MNLNIHRITGPTVEWFVADTTDGPIDAFLIRLESGQVDGARVIVSFDDCPVAEWWPEQHDMEDATDEAIVQAAVEHYLREHVPGAGVLS